MVLILYRADSLNFNLHFLIKVLKHDACENDNSLNKSQRVIMIGKIARASQTLDNGRVVEFSSIKINRAICFSYANTQKLKY